MKRRTLILGAGGALALVGVGGAYRVLRNHEAALAPWAAAARPQPDVRLHAFAHAILAPNPHNRQPWLIRLIGSDEAVLSCDLERRLPVTDPFDRQITIGFGCFIAIAEIAAAERGRRLEVEAFPGGEPGERLDKRPIALLRFVTDSAVAPDPLMAAVLRRRSVKRPFDMARPVADDLLRRLAQIDGGGVRFGAANDTAMVTAIKRLAWEAWQVEARTDRTWRETTDLMRIGSAEIEADPDGVSIGGPIMNALAALGQINRAAMNDRSSSAFRTGENRYRAIFENSPAFVWLSTSDEGRRSQLAAGRAYLRTNLLASSLGLSIHPVSQALQEFPEMLQQRTAMERLLGGGRVQMLARLGYGEASPPTPRWPLAAKLVG